MIAQLIALMALVGVSFTGGYVIGVVAERKARAESERIPVDLS